MIVLQSILDSTPIINDIARSAPQGVTGWGIALILSISFNYIIYKEFKFIQNKLLIHLDELNKHMEYLVNNFNHK